MYAPYTVCTKEKHPKRPVMWLDGGIRLVNNAGNGDKSLQRRGVSPTPESLSTTNRSKFLGILKGVPRASRLIIPKHNLWLQI